MEQSNLTIFTWLYSNFDSVLNGYIAQTSSAIVGAISPVAYTMFAIYVLLWGFSMIRGMIEEPVTDGLFRLLKIALIMGFALNAGRYQSDVTEFFMQTPDAMARILAFRTAETGDTSTFASLDTVVNRTVDVARSAWNQGGVLNGNMGMYFAAFVILAFGLAFCGAAGIMILMAKIAMVLLLALGPIFILMVMFKTTQRFFDAWLGQVINYMMLLVLTLAVTSMFLAMMEAVVRNAGDQLLAQATLEAVGSIFLVSMCCIALLFQVGPLASALAGGVALATTSAMRRVAGGTATATRAGTAASLVAGKATLGVGAIAVKAAGTMFRATNSVRRG